MSLEESKKYLEKLSLQEKQLSSFVWFLMNAKRYGNRIFLAGNGGSAYTIAHFASDLMNLGFDVFCMNDNLARLTAITNDYGWECAYTQQLTHFKQGDIMITASVHGGGKEGEVWSQNLLLVALEAKQRGGIILSLIGCDGGRLKELSNISIIVPSDLACYVEGFHSLLTHIICERLKKEGIKNAGSD